MSYLNNQKHHASQLLGLALAAAMLTSLLAVTSHSATRVRFSGAAKTNGATSSLTQPSSELKANGKIAFTSDRDGNREIYVMNNDGTNQTRLTNNSGADDYPTWSPDGSRIAFLSGNSLRLMNADGTNQTQLTTVSVAPDCANATGLSCGLNWSPDGTKIAFTDAAGIFIINVDGSNRINLTNHAKDTHPSWSPNGSRIVFTRDFGLGHVSFLIYTINADGSNLTPWNGTGSSGNNGDVDPAWSPDGNRIAAILNRFPADTSDLCIMNADGTRYTIDFVIERDHASPTWSPDGTKLAFGGVVDPFVQYINSEIFVINADGSGITRLTNTPGYESHPAWQPLVSAPTLRANGKIAFTSDRDGNSEIYVMDNDGTGQVRLTNNAGVDDFPTWSPDGRRIAYVSQNASGDYAIKLMNSDGTGQTELTTVTPILATEPGIALCKVYCGPSWSPLGTKIAFTDGVGGAQFDIFTINIDGSNRINLTNNPAHDYSPDWSPDGSRIVFVSERFVSPVSYHILHTMNADGSDVRALPSDGDFWDESPDWSPMGDKIVFAPDSEYFVPGLYTANADGTNRQLFDACAPGFCDEHRFNPKWSPDATKIIFGMLKSFSQYTQIYVKNVSGGGLIRLTNTPGRNFNPSWGPVPTAPSVCPNPIDCADSFVRQHYLDFLSREPDASGLAFWTNEITVCGTDLGCIEANRVNVSAAFFLSIEFQQTGYLLYRIYKSSYGNLPGVPVPIRLNEFLPDTQAIGQGVIVNQPGWEQVLENNKQVFTSGFVQRSGFTSAFPTSMTPAEFVDKLFTNAGVTPSATDRTAALSEFGSATNSADASARARALRRVAENSTLAQQEFNRAFVLMQYFGYLRRNPNDPPEPTLDYQGYNFWLTKLNSFNGDYLSAEMVKAFITSSEYRRRFGP